MGKLVNKAAKTGFNRPVAQASTEVTREWREVKVSQLDHDDLLAGFGVIKLITETCDTEEYYIQAGESNELFLEADKVVLAFVRKDS